MSDENRIVTVVELDASQAQQEIIKLNATAANSTKELEDRIDAKNKAIDLQNKLAEQTVSKTKESIANMKIEANLLIAAIQEEKKRAAALKGSLTRQDEYAEATKNIDTATRELTLTNNNLTKAEATLLKQTLTNVKAEQSAINQLDKLQQASAAVAAKLKAQKEAEEALAKVTINLSSTFEEVYGDLKPLTARMGEAEDRLYELALAGKTASKEYKDLLKNVANYKKTQQETDRIVDAAATTLSQNFANAANLAATAVQTVTSGLALVGIEGEAAEKVLVKVQAAMSFADSVKSLTEMGGSFKAFKTLITSSLASITAARAADIAATEAGIVAENQSTLSKIKSAVATAALAVATKIITAAQWLWNTAVLANPLVALAVAIVALIVGLVLLTKMLMDNAAANKKAAEETKKLADALDKESLALARASVALRQKNEQTLAMAKANGQSTKSIRALELKLIDEQIASDLASTATAKNTFIQERNNFAKLKASGASDEVIKAREKEVSAAYDTFKRENAALDQSYKKRAQLKRDHEVQIAAENTAARKKAAEDAKKAQKDREQAEKDAYDLRRRLAKAAIDSEEIDLNENKKDPNKDTLEQEKKLLKMKKDYELMDKSLLEQEKLVITKKYLVLEKEAVLKAEAEKTAKLLEQQKQQLALDEEDLKRRQAHGENTLSLELALLERKKNLELQNVNQTEEQKALIEAQYRARKEEIENEARYKRAEELLAVHEQDLEAARLRGEDTYNLEKQLREEARALELSDATLSADAKLAINKAYDNANTAARQKAIDQDLEAAGEAFGISKELKIAEMLMNAPTAIGNSFTKASEVYPAPLSLAMGAIGAAGVVVPIIKGLADIKKARFPKAKNGGGGSGGSAATAATNVSTSSVSSLANNNAARLGVDPSLGENANANAANKVMGSSSSNVVFSEGKYSEFQSQLKFKEDKTTI